MRILWFTITPAGFADQKNGYNGCGWITSLESSVKKSSDIELGISFIMWGKALNKKVNEHIRYYPISLPVKYTMKSRIFNRLGIKIYQEVYTEQDEINEYIKVIEDFKPDVIHIFGSEQSFGLISQFTDVPVVIHLQGLLNPYLNALCPPFYSEKDYLMKDGRKMYRKNSWDITCWKKNVEREVRILNTCKYFMGRTEWDKSISRLYSPDSTYYYCSEMLRDSFWDSDPWTVKNRDQYILMTTISRALYKGADIVLKTAKLLKEQLGLAFEWRIYGNQEFLWAEKMTGIRATSVNVKSMGVVNSDDLQKNLLDCDVYVHSSYIDNSPNSVCEAQLLGVPVVACNVGGLSSLVEHGKTGKLTPSNDPFMMATYIYQFLKNKDEAAKIGEEARLQALKRHNPDTILNDLLSIYKTLATKKRI